MIAVLGGLADVELPNDLICLPEGIALWLFRFTSLGKRSSRTAVHACDVKKC